MPECLHSLGQFPHPIPIRGLQRARLRSREPLELGFKSDDFLEQLVPSLFQRACHQAILGLARVVLASRSLRLELRSFDPLVPLPSQLLALFLDGGGCGQTRLKSRRLQRRQHLLRDPSFDVRGRRGLAQGQSIIGPQRGTSIGRATRLRVAHVHAFAASPASNDARQQRRAAANGAGRTRPRPILRESLLIRLEAIPGNVGGEAVLQKHQTLFGRSTAGTTALRATGLLASWIRWPMAVAISACINGMPQDVAKGLSTRLTPLQLSHVLAGLRPNWQADLVSDQVPKDTVNRALTIELIEDQPNDALHLSIRIKR
ncbi:MAG TPA: hypothetical protein VIG47_08135, partial [Gemmatimonadaceae bacterium]